MADAIPATGEMVSIIQRNFESKALDYKGPITWDSQNKKACCELVKDILAMANTDGGHVVIGVSEADGGFQLAGLTAEQAGTFESSEICRFVQKYADPPINVRIQKVSYCNLLFVILEIPRFADTPHICQKAFPEVLRERELYVRTDNNESAPIRSSSDFRSLIESAIRNRTDTLLSSFRSILTGARAETLVSVSARDGFTDQIISARSAFENRNPLKVEDHKYLVETIFQPQDFDQYKFTSRRLESAAQQAAVDYLEWPFLFFHYNRPDVITKTDDGLETLICTKDFANVDILDFWRLNDSGLFYKREVSPSSHTKPPTAHAARIIWQVTEAILCLTRLYETLFVDSEVLSLEITFSGTRGRVLIWPEIGFQSGTYEASRPTIEVKASFPLAEWRAGLEDHALALTRDVFRHFQLDKPDEARIKSQIQKLVERRL